MEKAVTVIASRRKDVDRMFWFLLAAGLLLFALVTIPPGARHARALRQDTERARRIVAQLERTNETLVQRERALQSDAFFNELVMRTKMKYTRPGEQEIQTTVPGRTVGLVDAPIVEDFIPTQAPAPGPAAQVTNWALLAASAILVASAFILFDRPSSGRPSVGRPSAGAQSRPLPGRG